MRTRMQNIKEQCTNRGIGKESLCPASLHDPYSSFIYEFIFNKNMLSGRYCSVKYTINDTDRPKIAYTVISGI